MIKSAHRSQQDILFYVMAAITMLSIFSSVLFQSIFPILVPLLFIGLYVLVVDTKFVYFLLLGLVCIGTEIELSGGLSTDLPNEPLMWVMTACYFLFLVAFPRKIWIPYKNPVTLLLILHLLWIFISVITAERQGVAIKFFLAKIWYVIPFYFMPFIFLKEKKDLKKGILYIISFTVLGASFVMLKHMTLGMSFDTIEKAVQPIFRNHVNYAALLVIVLPFIWISLRWKQKSSILTYFLWFANILIPVAIYFSYTRAAIGSIAIGAAAFVILRWKLTKWALLLASIGTLGGIMYLIHNNNFMEYAPEFKRTITHKEFDSLISATAKGQDLSTMERVYRWVAGVKMVADKPITGFGPNNFYPRYKDYTLDGFKTYVSRNPKQSGIHNYYLMLAVEQGIVGSLIFLAFCFVSLLFGERHYHKIGDPFYKGIVAAAYSSFIIILSLLIVNDLIEADKVGTFFFIWAAFLTLSQYWSRKYPVLEEPTKV